MISSVVSSTVCLLCVTERSFKIMEPKRGEFIERNIFPEKKCPHCAHSVGSLGTWCSSFGLVSSITHWSFHLLESPVTTKICCHIVYQKNKCKDFGNPDVFWGLLPLDPPLNQLILSELLEYTSSFILQVQWLLSILN